MAHVGMLRGLFSFDLFTIWKHFRDYIIAVLQISSTRFILQLLFGEINSQHIDKQKSIIDGILRKISDIHGLNGWFHPKAVA